MTKNSQLHHGGALLLLVIIISLITAIVSLTFFSLLTRYNQINTNTIKSESSYLLASKIMRDSISRHLAPAPFPQWPTFGADNQFTESKNINGTKYDVLVIQDPITKTITFEVTAIIGSTPRKLKASLIPPTIVTAKSDIIMLIDTSDSMSERIDPSDPNNFDTKLDVAKIAAKSFLDQFSSASNTRISIVSYSTDVYTNRSLDYISTDIPSAKIIIDNLFTNGSTNIGGALESANDIFNDPITASTPDRYVVLLTDGQPTVMKNNFNAFIRCKDLTTGAQQLLCLESSLNFTLDQSIILKNSRNTSVFTIGLGDPTDPQSINADLLKTISTSESYYYETPDAEQLTQIYQNIAKAILMGGTLQYREIIP